MKNLAKKHLNTLGALLINLIFCANFALAQPHVIEYTPKILEPASKSWYWTEIEELNDKGFRAMANGPDGTMLFGTEKGIYFYDGYSLAHHGQDRGLDDSTIASLYRTKSGRTYATTRKAMYILENDYWNKIYDGSYLDSYYASFAEDAAGIVWARSDNGVLRIDKKDVELIFPSEADVTGVTIDRRERIWVTLRDHNYIYECKPTAQKTRLKSHCIFHSPMSEGQQEYQKFIPLASFDDELWLVEKGPDTGVFRFNFLTREWKYENVIGFHSSLYQTRDGSIFFNGGNKIDIYKDEKWSSIQVDQLGLTVKNSMALESPDGKLWFGSFSGKVYFIDRSRNVTTEYLQLTYQDEGENGLKWFLGADDNGDVIVSFDELNHRWSQYRDNENIIDTPISLLVTRKQYILLVGSDGEDTAISIYDGKTWAKKIFPDFSPTSHFRGPFQSNDGTIYITPGPVVRNSQGYKGGLIRFKLEGSEIVDFQHLAPPHVPRYIQDVQQLADGSIWLSSKTLYRLVDNEAIQIDEHPRFKSGRSLHLNSDGKNQLWLSRFSYGLFSYSGNSWTHYPTDETVGVNSISYIFPSDEGKVYASTYNGIAYFDGESWHRNFLPPEFTILRSGGTIKHDREKSLWLNYSISFWYKRAAHVLNRKNVNMGELRSVRYRPDSFGPKVEILRYADRLAHDGRQNIMWKGNDRWNRTPARNLLYSYRLNGGAWSPYLNESDVSLWDLRDGKHTFELRAKDSDGNISQENSQLSFYVQPPIWKQFWFLLLIGFLVASIFGLIILIVREREKHIHAMEQLRLNYYTNITHELRTPLTVILGPLEKLRSQTFLPEQSKLIQLAYKSSKRLLQLVDQVLEIRRMETGNERLKLEQGDPIAFIRESLAYYLPLIDENMLTLKQELDRGTHFYSFDKDKIRKIVDNLIGNAIKYTPAGGTVTVKAFIKFAAGDELESADLMLSFEDTGCGITPDKQQAIYQQFSRGEHYGDLNGFGIGLAYVNQLVNILGAEISLTSPTDEILKSGTRFDIFIPMKEVLGLAPKVEAENLSSELDVVECVNLHEDKPILLIVDDNKDIREFLSMELQNEFTIVQAGDGLQGLDMAKAMVPDIVLSDVIMPELDGLEFCRLLKDNIVTSHIPVLLLTARRSNEQEIKGLQVGADDYVSKPVDVGLLRMRLHNLLQQRVKMREHFESGPSKLQLEKIAENNADKEFLTKITSYLDDKLSNAELDINDFARELAFSRTTLYRKIKAVTGQSPSAFIRTYRLHKAATLLHQESCSVTQAMHAVGFRDSSYFSRSFKQLFGVSPSKFTEEAVD